MAYAPYNSYSKVSGSSSSKRVVNLPALHAGQLAIVQHATRFNHVCMGRRFGKTWLLSRLAVEEMLKGNYVGVFTPQYKFLTEIYRAIYDILQPIKPEASRTDGIIRISQTGGRCDFWSLENEAAGRGRKYHLVLLDEVAFGKNDTMQAIWERAILPTLVDYKGRCFALSTPNGISDDNWFYQISTDPQWTKFQAPSSSNPYLPQDELERIRLSTHPLVWKQEFLAEFISWSGEQFFSIDDLLDENKNPIPDDYKLYGSVFAVVDTAIKTGTENDATAVIYFGTQPDYMYHDRKTRSFILDWHIEQIEGASLSSFIPSVLNRMNELSYRHQCALAPRGIFIEDKGSGTIVLQHFSNNSAVPVFPINSKLTQMGKDERAFAASPYISSKMVKLTNHAFNKIMPFKGKERNYLLSQLSSFRIGDKDAAKRADDLTDCFTYGTVLSVGKSIGF